MEIAVFVCVGTDVTGSMAYFLIVWNSSFSIDESSVVFGVGVVWSTPTV